MADDSRGEDASKQDARRERFLAAALNVFLERGFEAAPMAEIVRRAGGGSLSTLYELFGSKDKLFEEAISARVKVFSGPMEFELSEHASIREALTRVGERLLQTLLLPESLEIARLMISQSKKFPEVSAAYQRGTERIRQSLTRYLEERAAAGEFKTTDPDRAAMVFFDLLRYRMPIKAVLDANYRPDEDEIREAVRGAVAVYLGGVEAL